MYKKDVGFIFAILKMCDDIEVYKSEYKSVKALLAKRIGLNACLMNISQIGEFAGKLSDEFKKQFNKIEWKKIKGMRNVIIHDYLAVDLEKIENILENEIPKLIQDILLIVNFMLETKAINNEFLEFSSKDFQIIHF